MHFWFESFQVLARYGSSCFSEKHHKQAADEKHQDSHEKLTLHGISLMMNLMLEKKLRVLFFPQSNPYLNKIEYLFQITKRYLRIVTPT